ncbi:unnamed protein product [Owenia fusiformis]|uniref:Importin N-terminal domain-containing protein n=1 Tax=Owenia fusiformis TaxID=6347 RepID=A0A8S4NGC6_OWEFU|nr:unnamed protein product [Owenia fusiformis]
MAHVKELEEILSKLNVPDNEIISQATAHLRELFKDPGIVPALCTILASSQNAQVRQTSAVLIRRKVEKASQWRNITPDIAQNIRQNLLQVLVQEPEKSVRNSIAQIVAAVAKHDLPESRWPELFQFLEQTTGSADPAQKEVGMFVLSSVASVAAEQLKPMFSTLLTLFDNALDDRSNPLVPFYAIQCMTYFVFLVGTEELKIFSSLLPKVIQVIHNLLAVDEEKACEAMELFDELVECEVSVVAPHIKAIMQLCLQIAGKNDLEEATRVKGMSFISWLTRLKKKAILKYKLVNPILNVLFPIMCTPPDDEDDDDTYTEQAETTNPAAFAATVIDTMALHLPPEKLIPQLMTYIEPALQSEDKFRKKAAFITMAVISEGCADNIRQKHLHGLLQCTYKGMSDSEVVVRNAAMFALGQFSEFLQPDISKYAAELLPVLLDYITKVIQESIQTKKDTSGTTKTFYALEMFCENLDKDILTYLPKVMEHLITALEADTTVHVKELAISAIGATANAAKEAMFTYFDAVMNSLKPYLDRPHTNEDELKLQTQAIDTLGVLSRTLGEQFLPLCPQCVNFGLTLLQDATDPDLKRSIYGMFAAMSCLLKFEMSQYLARMVAPMLESMQSTEGITVHVNEEETKVYNLFDEEDISGEDDDNSKEEEGVAGYSVENAYLEEKEDACTALGELAVNTGVGFMPYMEKCYTEATKLLEHPASTIKRGAVTSIGHFCIALSNVITESHTKEGQAALSNMLSTCVPKFITMVRQDSDRQVAMTTLETIQEMLEKIKAPVLEGQGHLEELCACLKEVLLLKTASQDENEADNELDDQQAEHDEMLIENAGDVIPAIAKVIGGEAFAPYFAAFLPELLKRLKRTSTIAEKSFAMGTLAEMVDASGSAASMCVGHLYPVFLSGLKEDDEEVRSNAVYGLGVLAANGGEACAVHYPAILKSLFDLVTRETDKRVADNVCAAVCRMILANLNMVPLTEVSHIL